MTTGIASLPFIELLHDQIDITRIPFSDRGSRLLIYKYADRYQLFLKLAERLIVIDPGLEAYLHRQPFIEDLSLIDRNGSELNFELSTSPEMIRFQTEIGAFMLTFQDENTLAFGLPPNEGCGLRFRLRELKNIRRLSKSTNGVLIAQRCEDLEDGSVLLEYIVRSNDDGTITLHVGNQDHLEHQAFPFSQVYSAAKARWENWFAGVPFIAEPFQKKYAYAWWVLANNTISPLGYVTRESIMPSKAFYVGLWLWDNAMHAIALRHLDTEFARDQLRVMLDHQLSNGMLPDCIFDEGIVSELNHPLSGAVTKPPILAWAALKLHSTNPDIGFLKEIYDPLVECNAWWFRENDEDKDGLVQYSHPYSSGLDNSPLWDYGLPVESPDINTYLCIQMDCLAVIAQKLGKADDAKTWRGRSQQLAERMIKFLWNEKVGVFQAMHNETAIPVLTPFNLYPLWTGRLPPEIVRRLVQHLQSPDLFWGEYPVATVAKNDPTYDPEAMWRGSTWANINYFFIEALQKIGRLDLAGDLREKTLSLIMDQPDLREYYSSDNGKAPSSAATMFGWTAAVFIDLAIQATGGKMKGVENLPNE